MANDNKEPTAAEKMLQEKKILEDQLAAANDQLKTQEASIQGILNNPQMMEVYNAQKEGKSISIVNESDVPKQTAREMIAAKTTRTNDSDINALDNSQLVDVVLEAIDLSIDQKLATHQKDILADTNIKFGRIGTAMADIQKTTIATSVQIGLANIQAKYPDFGSYQEQVLVEMKDNPAINMEQAYFIVKGKFGEPNVTQYERQNVNERPNLSLANQDLQQQISNNRRDHANRGGDITRQNRRVTKDVIRAASARARQR